MATGKWRLKLEYFETENDDKGYTREINRQDTLEVIVNDVSSGKKLLVKHLELFANAGGEFVPVRE